MCATPTIFFYLEAIIPKNKLNIFLLRNNKQLSHQEIKIKLF